MLSPPLREKEKGGDSILTGTVNNGDTVPLPQGCNAEDCKTMLAIYDILNESAAGGNYGLSPLYGFGIEIDETRKVNVHQNYTRDGAVHSSVASYIVIGQKGSSSTEIPQIKF